MLRFRAFTAAWLFLHGTAVGSLSQDHPGQQREPVIRTDVNVVLVPVTVTDRSGAFVPGLRVQDFLLLDEKRPRPVQLDYPESFSPISIVIAVETTDVAAAAIAKLNKVGSMVQPLITGERGEAALLAFDEDVRLVRDFTSDPGAIISGFRSIRAGDSRKGRSIDALAEGVRMLAERKGDRRRVVVLVAESRDRGSTADLWETLAQAQREAVAVYPVTFSPYATPWTAKPEDLPAPTNGGLIPAFQELGRLGKVNAAEAMARATGGAHLSFLTLRTLERAVAGVGEELHSQYLLSFYPEAAPAGTYRRLDVAVPGAPELVVRARPGYWSK